MRKIITSILFIALIVGLLAGCGEKDIEKDNPEGDTITQSSETDKEESKNSADYSGIKVGLLLNQTLTDNGWSQSMGASMERSKEELGLSDEQVIIVESIPDGSIEADSTIAQLVDEGCNLIIGGSGGFITNFDVAASKYPDVYFAMFEGKSSENYCSFTIKDIEAIFMCGYAAGLMSEVDMFGFVAAQPTTSVVRAIDAWSAGAKAARPNATVQLMWVNSWYDPAAEKECASSLIQSGVQCMGYHGGTTAVCEACEDAGVYVTGFHTDKQPFAPNAVLTSFCWNWTPVFNEIITQVASDSWTSDTKFADMTQGAATIAPWNTDIMPEDVIAKCDKMYDAIINGTYVVMQGPLYDNQGNEVLADGETFTLDQLTNCYFLLDNVVGELPQG